MSNFLIIAILVSALGTECFGSQHLLLESVTDYLNQKSSIKNLLESNRDKDNAAPRGTMSCALASANVFEDSIQSLCEEETDKMTEKLKATHLDTTETQQDIQTMQWAPLSVRHEQFAEGYVSFLARFWNTALAKLKQCVPTTAKYMRADETRIHNSVTRKVEKFTVNLVKDCRIPLAFYPGITFRRKFTKILEKDETIETDEITEGSSFLEDMKKVFRLSKEFSAATENPVMINLTGGFQKGKSFGCVRNASFMLFAELKGHIPEGCAKANEEIAKFNAMVIFGSPRDKFKKKKEFQRKLSMLDAADGIEPEEVLLNEVLFETSMETIVPQLKIILGIFETCFSEVESDQDYNETIRKLISHALNDFDLEMVKCEVPLKYVHPISNPTPISVTEDDRSQQSQHPPNPQKFINFEETTETEKFFKESPPRSIRCFKSTTTFFFGDLKELMREKCSQGEAAENEFVKEVKSMNKGVLIDMDSKDSQFELGMNYLSQFGLKAFNAYQRCLEKENIFADDEKTRLFTAAVVNFQDTYVGCAGQLLIPKPAEPQTKVDPPQSSGSQKT